MRGKLPSSNPTIPRIPLLPGMKLLFEISSLKFATPATVSRAGILYINSGGHCQF